MLAIVASTTGVNAYEGVNRAFLNVVAASLVVTVLDHESAGNFGWARERTLVVRGRMTEFREVGIVWQCPRCRFPPKRHSRFGSTSTFR